VNARFLGSGDAFGSGGRFQNCIYVRPDELDAKRLLVGSGASSLMAVKRFELETSDVDVILLSHHLFICECNFFEDGGGHHLDYQTLMGYREYLGCHRLVLTHMGEEMLRRIEELDVEGAEDGKSYVL
jgi:hypothetical protein